jgi:hypothetical protein
MTTTFIISLLLGILIFLIAFWYFREIETFSEEEKPAENTTELLTSLEQILTSLKTSTSPTNFQYVEDKELIPLKQTLMIYLSTFSDKTYYDNSVDIYIPQSQKWNNYMNDNQSFFIVSNNVLPATIKPTGLPLKNVTLNGIRSDEINPADYRLSSFSASFYIKFNNITFDEQNKIELMDIFVETPNYVKLLIEPIADDTENVNLILHVGETSSRTSVKIPISTLLSNGNKVFITMTYDENYSATEAMVKLYIGEEPYEHKITPKPTIILGNSRIRMNSSGLLDATLYAFMFYKSAITIDTHKELKTYVENQTTGVSSILTALTTMTEDQIKNIRSYVSDQTMTIDQLKKKLEQCSALQEQTKKALPFKYAVNMEGTSDLTAEDLKQCSILGIKTRGTKTPAQTATGSDSTSATETTSKSRFFIDVPFLRNILPKKLD